MTAIVITESEAGAKNGVATLNSEGKLPEEQLPSSVANGSLPSTFVNTETGVTATPGQIVSCTMTAAFTVKLTGAVGSLIAIHRVSSGANVLTIEGETGQTINGTATMRLYGEGESRLFKRVSETEWEVIAGYSGPGRPTYLPGATSAARFAGGVNEGHPTTGAHEVGEFVVDHTGKFWICTAEGTPGTWKEAGGGTAEKGETGPEGPEGGTGYAKPLGNKSGTIKINLSETYEGHIPNVYTMTATGDLVIELEHWRSGVSAPLLVVTQGNKGGHTIEVVGATAEPEAAVYNTSENAVNFIPLLSVNGGAETFILTGPKGQEGSEGKAGPEGKAGAWTPLKELGPKMSYVEGSGLNKTEARSEGGGSRAYLRGEIEVKTGESITTTDTLLTLPEALWPKKEINVTTAISTGTIKLLTISTAGVVKLGTSTLAAGNKLLLDQVSWSLT